MATAGFAYVRFHGSTGRYRGGDYPDEQLKEWAQRIRRLSGGLPAAYVYLNNDIGVHAVNNARTLAEFLGH